MFNQANLSTLIMAVVSMIILTALSRILPFFLPNNSPIIRFFTKENSPLAPLGGTIIITITVLLAVPFFQKPSEHSPLLAVITGVLATIIATHRRMNTGICVIIGMLGFLCGFFLNQFLS